MRCQNAHACRFLYFKYVLPAGPIATSNNNTILYIIIIIIIAERSEATNLDDGSPILS